MKCMNNCGYEKTLFGTRRDMYICQNNHLSCSNCLRPGSVADSLPGPFGLLDFTVYVLTLGTVRLLDRIRGPICPICDKPVKYYGR